MSDPLRPNEVFLGKYRVERVLGQGGMGTVVAAQHLHLNKSVAIKFLLPALVAQADVVQRFVREARAAASIESEHVAHVFDVGTTDEGLPYMVMEHLQGQDLGDYLSTHGRLGVEETVDYILQACEAIVEAHRQGIVHRDLKPANLFLATQSDGTRIVKVLDFGISKITAGQPEGSMALTATTAVMGSPLYMSPEQMRSTANVGPQTDVWALGVIMFELLTGVVPFNGSSITEVLSGVLTEPPPPLGKFGIEVPAEFESVIRRCLEKDPAARYRNIAELALNLRTFASAPRSSYSIERILRVDQSKGYQATAPGLMPSVRPPQTSATNAGLAATAQSPGTKTMSRSRTGLLIAGPVLLACLTAGALAFVLRGRGDAATMPVRDAASQPPVIASVATPPSAPEASGPAIVVLPPVDAAPPLVAATRPPPPTGTARKNKPPPTASPPPTAASTAAPPPTKKNPLDVAVK